jgi:predicted ATPase
VQSALADTFISAVQSGQDGQLRNVQLIIESHSESFLLRLQRRLADGTITPDDLAVYFVRQEPNAVALEELQLDIFGNIANWPENFFGDEMGEIAARTQAAMERRKKEQGSAHG